MGDSYIFQDVLLWCFVASMTLVTAAHDVDINYGNSSDVFPELKRWKREAIVSVYVCQKNQWQCRDGSCISVDNICDGVVDCPDSSDETHALCRKMQCPSNLFRCTYGACVNGDAACNGEVECADSSDELLPQCRHETPEIDGQFQCQNGPMIPAANRCDGVADCTDGSDETVSSCGEMVCLPHLFQCAYGACANKGSDCDGKVDCADGSDESFDLCGGTAPDVTVKPTLKPKDNGATGSRCTLPKHPEHGTYQVLGARRASPGQVSSDPVLKVTCETGFEPSDSSDLHCVDGVWFGQMPRCIRKCKLVSNPSVAYQCELVFGNNTRSSWPCEEYEVDGTAAVPKCQENYHFTGIAPHARCVDGQWENLITCSPGFVLTECGTVVPKGEQLMIGGRDAVRGELTWHAGVYQKSRKFEQICGGSLINKKVILSAAHCFWNPKTNQNMPSFDYAVAVGKMYRPWFDRRDTDAQKRDVSDIEIPTLFRGPETNYQSDIALLFVETPFDYTKYVRPVCVDFDENFNSQQTSPGQMGKVAGWGLTDPNGRPSEVLRVVDLPVVDNGMCLDKAPHDFRGYITIDKMCAGFYTGTALCKGDSGGGLSFPSEDRGTLRYYLRGIVSTAPRNNDLCNSQTITTFTKIMSYKSFINKNVEGGI